MSMKWMRGPYHNSTVYTFQKLTPPPPTEPNPFRVIVWYGVASLWPPTTYKGCQTPFICMKWIWYEYEVDEGSQSYPTACPQ